MIAVRRIDHGVGVRTRRYELMVCVGGFYAAWSVDREVGFMRVCVGPGRLFFNWPARKARA